MSPLKAFTLVRSHKLPKIGTCRFANDTKLVGGKLPKMGVLQMTQNLWEVTLEKILLQLEARSKVFRRNHFSSAARLAIEFHLLPIAHSSVHKSIDLIFDGRHGGNTEALRLPQGCTLTGYEGWDTQ